MSSEKTIEKRSKMLVEVVPSAGRVSETMRGGVEFTRLMLNRYCWRMPVGIEPRGAREIQVGPFTSVPLCPAGLKSGMVVPEPSCERQYPAMPASPPVGIGRAHV